MAFCEQGPRTVCILSAVGPIRNVTIRQPPSASSLACPDVSYEVIFLTSFKQPSSTVKVLNYVDFGSSDQ